MIFWVLLQHLLLKHFAYGSATKTFKENRAVNTNNNKLIPDEICDKIDDLNIHNFIPDGFKVKHVSVVRVTIAEGSKGVLASEQTIVVENNKNEASKATQKIELRENVTQG